MRDRLRLHRRVVALLLATSLAVAACGGDDTPETSTTASAADESAATIVASPENDIRPLPVEFGTEAEASVTMEIGADGGTVATAGTDGTRYTLTVPPKALFGPVEITMTPISSAETTFEPVAFYGVVLEPAGLVLFEPATLAIDAEGLSPSETTGFRSSASGEGFHLAPATVGDTATVTVPHFSGAGLATSAELFTLEELHLPTEREGRVVQDIQTLLHRVEDEEARNDSIAGALDGWFLDIGVDALNASDAATVEELLGEFMAARNALLEAEEAAGVELTAARESMARTGNDFQLAIMPLFDDEHLRCLQDQDPDAAFAMLRWALLIQWLNQEGLGDFGSDDLSAMDQAMRSCLVFELEFQSLADGTTEGIQFASTMTATVDLRLPDEGGNVFLLEGRFTIPELEGLLLGDGNIESLDCASSTPFGVFVDFELNVRFGVLAESTLGEPVVWMAFRDRPLWDCFPGQDAGGALWRSWFYLVFADRVVDDYFVFQLARTESGDDFAVDGGSGQELTVTITYQVKIRHSPQLP